MNFSELTPANQEDMIAAGTDFMRAITEIWGPEKGMEMWDVISGTVGDDFKGAVFFTMLTGNHLGDVLLINADVPQYGECIKIVRRYTGYGLKEAKDACDRARGSKATPEKLPLVDRKERKDCVAALKALGCTVQ